MAMFDKDGYLKSDLDHGTFYNTVWKHSHNKEMLILQEKIAEQFKDITINPNQQADLCLTLMQNEKNPNSTMHLIKNRTNDTLPEYRNRFTITEVRKAFQLTPENKTVVVTTPKSMHEQICEEIDQEIIRVMINGMFCAKCNTLHHYVEQGNQPDGSYLCYECDPED